MFIAREKTPKIPSEVRKILIREGMLKEFQSYLENFKFVDECIEDVYETILLQPSEINTIIEYTQKAETRLQVLLTLFLIRVNIPREVIDLLYNRYNEFTTP